MTIYNFAYFNTVQSEKNYRVEKSLKTSRHNNIFGGMCPRK